jgi:acetyl esterase/lipase
LLRRSPATHLGSGDKDDHANIPTYFRGSDEPLTVVIPNYRLSHHPDHPERIDQVHPTHILDVVRALLWMKASARGPLEVHLAGHSCGAHILSFILCNLDGLELHLTREEMDLLAALRDDVVGYAFLDGIYDLPDMIEEYPDYAFFVEKAFGDDRSLWSAASVTRLPGVTIDTSKRLLVAHSREDELLTTRQSKLWFNFLSDKAPVTYDEVTLQGKHDASLQNEQLGVLLARFINP